MTENRTRTVITAVVLAVTAVTARAQVATNIAAAKEDLDNNYFADHIGTEFIVEGRVTSPNFDPARTEMYLQDTNDQVGIQVRLSVIKDTNVLKVGVLASAQGFIGQTNGMRYIQPTLGSQFSVIDPTVVAFEPVYSQVSNFVARGEDYESSFVVVSNATLAFTNWPTSGGSGSNSITDGTGAMGLYIDADTDIDGQLPPTNVFTVRGILSQYDRSTNMPNGGYQILPRFYSDIIQAADNQPPQIFIFGSNDPVSVAVNTEIGVNLLGQDRNGEDALALSLKSGPAGAAVEDFGTRLGRFTWTPDDSYVGLTTAVVFEVTDGLLTNEASLNIYVLSAELANVVVNEIHWDPSPTAGDANNDGVIDTTQDEFVEIVNNNTQAMDITGWVIRKPNGVLFTFPATVLESNTAVVVFGGGVPSGLFGGATVYAPTNNWGGLTNPNSTNAVVILLASNGTEVSRYDYNVWGTPDQSITRTPEVTGSFEMHTVVNPLKRYSPGTKANGQAFEGAGIANLPPDIVPIGDTFARVGQVRAIGVTANDPELNPVTLSASNGPATATFTDNGNGTGTYSYTGQVADAGMTFTVTVYAADASTNSTETFRLYVVEGRYSGLVINEYLPDPNATGIELDSNNDGTFNQYDDEFIEIVNGATNPIDLAGCFLAEGTTLRHSFGSYLLPTGGSFVVFGGGSAAFFTNPPAAIASSGGLNLINGGAIITLYSPDTNILDQSSYSVQIQAISWTRSPDFTGDLTDHLTASAGASRSSPGRRLDGTAFLTNIPPQIAAIGDKLATESNALVFAVRASETDGDLVTLTASNLPASAVFLVTNGNGSSAGSFVWSNATPVGVYTTTFYAVDKDGMTNQPVIITVSNAPVVSVYTGIVWINELHYDNTGADADEGVEIAGPAGTDLSGYTLYPYNGSGGIVYSPTTTLSGVIGDEGCGYGALWFALVGLQNGGTDGIALVRNSDLRVIQFLSYEGVMTAANGPATGMTSVDIGVNEPNTLPLGLSLQLEGSGTNYNQFTWTTNTSSHGVLNANQTISPCGGGGDVDGIPVSWWDRHGIPALERIATNNPDDDINSNFEEFVADTDPTDDESYFVYQVTNMTGVGTMQLLVGPPTTNSRVYDAFWCADLINQGWTPFGFDVPGQADGSAFYLTVTNDAAGRFYRTGVKVP